MSGRKAYGQEFKSEAVKLVTDQGLTPTRVARDFGVDPQTIRRWLHELAPTSEQRPAPVTNAVVTALQRALVQRKPDSGMLHHRDRGSQYASCE